MSRAIQLPILAAPQPSPPALLGGAALLAAVTHLALLGVFVQAGSLLLAAANVGSVLLYLVVWLLARLGLGRALTQSMMGAEVLANAVLGVLLLGWNSEFAACLAAILAVVAAVSATRGRQKLMSTFLVVGLYGSLALLNSATGWSASNDTAPAPVTYGLHLFNLACVLLLPASSGGLYQRLVNRVMGVVQRQLHLDRESGLANRSRMMAQLRDTLKLAGFKGNATGEPATPLSAVLVVLDARVAGSGDRADARTVREVAQALRKGLRVGDSIGRWGEHRFFVLLPDSDPPAARIVTERMRALVQALQLRASGNGELRQVSLLMGVAPAIPGDDAEDLVERCESALRASRAAGRRRLSSRRALRAA